MKKVLPIFLLIGVIAGISFWPFYPGESSKAVEKAREVGEIPGKTVPVARTLPPDPRPNIVLINLDDADCNLFSPEMLELYPAVNKLAKRSIQFTNLHVTTPFCGPSRASLFRGQYAHRTGVRVNIPESRLSLRFKGGYKEYLRQGHDHDELGVWLKRGGYRTIHIGKYHHNGFDRKKPDGFDDFYASLGGRYHGTFQFTTREEPKGQMNRNDLDVYRTDREAEDAVAIIRQHTSRRAEQTASGKVAQPFFMYYAPLAPHRPIGNDFAKMVDAKKYGDWHPELTIPETPDFDEADMFDKPLIRQSSPYTESEISEFQREHLCRARAVKSVDDFIRKLVGELEAKGLYENTWFLFTSDNGYQLGHHRLHNKLDPYRMSTTAPLFVCGPGVEEPTTKNHLLAHIDLCPTILDLAECPKPKFLDGKSFAELIPGSGPQDEESWREPVLLENWQVKRNRTSFLPGTYCGLRYHDKLYIEWATGDREYYDLKNDPFELENVYDRLSRDRKQVLRKDLFATRSEKMDPIVTVIPRPVLSTHLAFPYCVRGMAEDDRCVDQIKLMVRHIGRGYWNGEYWQSKRTYVQVSDFAKDQQMVAWRYDIRDLVATLGEEDSEVVNDRKIFRVALQAFAYDAEGNESEESRIQMYMPFTGDPWHVRTATAPTAPTAPTDSIVK
jgi:arylsulfatase A-like enzyme